MENKFKSRLRELRLEKSLLQDQLALATGIGQASISAWELGTRIPRMDSLITLAKFFGCTIDYLVGLEPE